MGRADLGWKARLRRWLWLRNRRRLVRREIARATPYADWCARHDTLAGPALQALQRRQAELRSTASIAVFVSLKQASSSALQATWDSLQAQLYGHWQVMLTDADECAPAARAWAQTAQQADARLRFAVAAPALTTCDWIAFANAGERWREHALFLLIEAAAHRPQARLIYADHDSLDAQGLRCEPHFKCDWNPELLLSHDYIGPSALWHRSLLDEMDVKATDQPHRRALKATDSLARHQVLHVPHVLLHRPLHAPLQSDAEAAAAQLEDRGMAARVEPTSDGARVRFALPQPLPLVSIIVPTRNGLQLLRRCIDSLLRLTDYPAQSLEVLIVDNGSDDPACLRYLHEMTAHPQVRVLRDDSPFNYAALNNAAAGQCRGELLVLLNNDIEVIRADWLREMLGWALRPGTGAVGARLLYEDGSLQHAGVVLGLGGEAGHVFRHRDADDGGYLGRAQRTMALSAVTAACLMVRRSTYLAVGGMDAEHFAVAYNDIDFCLRLQQAGLRNLYTPHAVLLHLESASRGSERSGNQLRRLQAEQAALHARWGTLLQRDPAYNPNLSLASLQFALAEPPRVNLAQPWFMAADTP